MRLLLDTHVLIWALSEPSRLNSDVRNALTDPLNEVFVSAVSAWEIAIKQSLGKVVLPAPAETWLPNAVSQSGLSWIPITHEETLRVRTLPWHHRDPFDRLLVAQTFGGLTLVTHDKRMQAYNVPTLWT